MLFGLVAMFYAVTNLGSMGLELKLRETVKSLRSVRVLGLTLGWSWIVGPAFAVLLTKVLPMTELLRHRFAHFHGGAMFMAITAFPDLDPNLLAMVLWAVPVPLITWVFLAKFFASHASVAEVGCGA